MTSHASLYRFTNASETESGISDNEKILFDESPISTTAGKLLGTSANIVRNFNIHPTPNRHLNQLEDGKLDYVEVVVRGIIISPSSEQASSNLYTWMKQDMVNSNYPKGRIGYRSDKFPVFDVVPTATIGYFLTSVNFEYDYEFEDRLAFTAILRRNGTV